MTTISHDDWAEQCWASKIHGDTYDLRLTLVAWADAIEEEGRDDLAYGLRSLAHHPYGTRCPGYNTLSGEYYWTEDGPYKSALTRKEFSWLRGTQFSTLQEGKRRYFPTLREAFFDAARALFVSSLR